MRLRGYSRGGACSMTVPTLQPAPIVLVVDDDCVTRKAVSAALAMANFRVLEAGDGAQALELASRGVDLILLDVELPDLNGFEVCRRLRNTPATSEIPVLFLSGARVAPADQVSGFNSGAVGYLTKPVDPELLVAQVSAHVRAAEAEQRLRSFIENALDILYAHDLDGNITSWNRAGERLLGYTRHETVGMNIAQIVAPEQLALAREMTARKRAGKGPTTYELEVLAKDGRRVPLEINSRLVSCEGKPARVEGIARDLSPRLRLEAQLRQAQKMEAIGRLAGGVAHDFNNLLTVINGCCELLLGMLQGQDAAHSLTSQILEAGERAASLTRQLLAYSRRQVLQPAVLDLNALIRGVEKLLRRVLGEDVLLETDYCLEPLTVRVDPGPMEQAVMNLAVNARDAMPQGGRLTIRTHAVAAPEGPWAGLEVADTGVGMDGDTKARIFEPFFTTKEVGKGTGLGLSMVQGFVAQSGGRVEVDSEQGIGTTFRIRLPRIAVAQADGTGSGETAPIPCGVETVLVVEDEDGVRRLACAVLESLGYRVIQAANPAEALRLCAEYPNLVDLLITDVVMPGAGGRFLAEQLQARQPRLRVLYVSGYTDDAVVRHGVSQAEVQFLAKPFTRRALAEKVRAVLDAPTQY